MSESAIFGLKLDSCFQEYIRICYGSKNRLNFNLYRLTVQVYYNKIAAPKARQ